MEYIDEGKAGKPVILVDMDDVMADFYTAATSVLPNSELRERTEFYVEHNYPAEFHSLIESAYLRPGFFDELNPLPDLHEGWQQLIDYGYKPIVASSPISRNKTCEQDKRRWLDRIMGPSFGPMVSEDAIIDKDKWKYSGLALIDDRPAVFRGDRGEADWSHILFGWRDIKKVPLADTAFRLLAWKDVEQDLIPTLDNLRDSLKV